MSRIGKRPVAIPSGVTATVEGQTVKVKGPKGQLQFVVHDDVEVKFENGQVKVAPRVKTNRAQAMYGTARAQVANLVEGVTKGFEKKLEITGVGYRAAMQGKNLQLALGYSHDVVYAIPEGITIAVPKPTRDHDHRQRSAARRPGRRRDPRLPSAGALQGQGREVRQRIHLPQGRQEEVTEPVMSLKVTNARRKQRVRLAIRRSAGGRPRLSVFRSSKHIYAQVIDDQKGETLASASSLEKTMRDAGKTGADIDAAKAVGKLLAERAAQKGVKEVVFDRGAYIYHGRVKALADAAREGGLSF
ncbi:ribosomal protein L18 [Bradyrhizobium sp. USDA 4451]